MSDELERAHARLRVLDDALETQHAKLVEVADKLRAERALTDALVASLPKCDAHSDRPATKSFGRGVNRFCDECGAPDAATFIPAPPPDYPRASPLRAIFAVRTRLTAEAAPARWEPFTPPIQAEPAPECADGRHHFALSATDNGRP